MSKRNKKRSMQGTYALCVTIGLIIGLGFGPSFDNILLTTLGGGMLGAAAGYWFTHLKTNRKH